MHSSRDEVASSITRSSDHFSSSTDRIERLDADSQRMEELLRLLDAEDASSSDATTGPASTVDSRLQAELPAKPADARFQTLDAVRGAACLMLMFYHATFYAEHSWVSSDPSTWTTGGLAINLVGRLWMGVPMFFVVSGYCIAASIDSLRRKPYSIRQYFHRRFHRIYPPLWAGFTFAVCFTLIIGCLDGAVERCFQLPRLSSFSATDWIANYTATASWLPPIMGQQTQHLMANTWTLCYEEQFYVVAGLLLVVASRRFFLASYLIAGGTLIARHVCRYCGISIDGFFFDGHWLLFACGILMYQQVNYLRGRQATAAWIVLTIGSVYGLYERIFALDPHDRHVGEYIFVACGFAIILAVAKRWDRQLSTHWTLRPFASCGKISYSLYLTHFPITVFIGSTLAFAGITRDAHVFLVTIPLCLLASFPVALVFYHLVEKRFVNDAKPSAPGSSRRLNEPIDQCQANPVFHPVPSTR
ncbi:MAG: acyltransferase [Pirellulaceae bacterium]